PATPPPRLSLLRHPHPVQPRHRTDPLLREAVGGTVGGDPLALGDLEDSEQRLVDLTRLLLGPFDRPAVQLAVEVDDPTTIDDVVRRVEDSPLFQLVAVPILRQLVIGPTGDDLGLDPREGL